MAPESTEVPVTWFCNTPFTRTIIVLLRHTMSHAFHSPMVFSELGCFRGALLALGSARLESCEPPFSRTSPAFPDCNWASKHSGQTLSGGFKCTKTPLLPALAGQRHSRWS